MRHSSLVKIFMTASIIACVNTCYAGDTTIAKYPRIILVQLNSEGNRIAAMIKAKAYKEAEEVKADAANVRTKMIHDFTVNLDYCPVYYYMDSNADLVKNRLFTGILMNADGSPATDPALHGNDRDYIIAYYGYALSQSKSNAVVTDRNKYIYDPDSPPGKGLILLNDQFRQISYVFKLGYGDLSAGDKKGGSDYYSSQHYEIEYFPLARLLNQKLNGKRGKRNRIKSARYHG